MNTLDNIANGTQPYQDVRGAFHVNVPRDHPAPLTIARRLIREAIGHSEPWRILHLIIELDGETATHWHYREAALTDAR